MIRFLRAGLILALSACAAASVARAPEPVAAQRVRAERFVPKYPGAKVIRGSGVGEAPGDASVSSEAALLSALERALMAKWRRSLRGGGLPVRESRIVRVAEDFARLCDPGDLALQQFLLAHHGVPEPDVVVQVFRSTPRSDDELVERVTAALRSGAGQAPPRAFGLAAERRDGAVCLAVVLLEEILVLEPVPRQLPVDGTARIRGRVRPNLHTAEVVVATPDGRLGRIPITRDGPGFDADFRCASGSGRYQVEVVASGPQGVTVLANFPIYCGVAPPGDVAMGGTTAFARHQDPVRLERELFELCNRARHAAGLPALTRDEALDQVARGHSRDMAAAGRVAHRLERTGLAPDRLAAAGIQARVVMENVGAQSSYQSLALGGAANGAGRSEDNGASAQELHDGFMSSPGHRANILAAAVTHFGVGVTSRVDEAGIATFYVTQLFVAY